MRIFIITAFFPGDRLAGSEIQCQLICKYLSRKGHRTYFIAMDNPLGKASREENEGYTIIRLNNKNEFIDALREYDPQICYIRTFRYIAWLTRQLSKRPNIKMIFHVSSHAEASPLYGIHTQHLNPKRLLGYAVKNILHFFQFLYLYKMDQVLAISNDISKKISKFGIKSLVFYNILEDAGLPKQKTSSHSIVWVSNIKLVKRPDLFIQLARKMAATNISFTMIGNTQYKGYNGMIEAASKELAHFRYLGPQSYQETTRMINDASILVHTASSEGWGNIYIQSWMCGTPTIALGYDPDGVIEENKIGYLTTTVDECMMRVNELLANESLRTDMGKRARAYYQANHLPAEKIDLFEKILCGVLA